jgi:squalene-hopene/tetraprenyl-beta-curcumene cyclase
MAKEGANHIFAKQLLDGGWNIYYGGPSEVNATIKCYLALKLAGVPVTDPRMLRAREVALNLGGVPRMNTFSKLYLAIARTFSLGLCSDHSLRSDPHRQMVLRELQ